MTPYKFAASLSIAVALIWRVVRPDERVSVATRARAGFETDLASQVH